MHENRNKIEEAIFKKAGGGEKGQKAVDEYRNYKSQYYAILADEMKEKQRNRYLPRKEKETGTSTTYTEIDDKGPQALKPLT